MKVKFNTIDNTSKLYKLVKNFQRCEICDYLKKSGKVLKKPKIFNSFFNYIMFMSDFCAIKEEILFIL